MKTVLPHLALFGLACVLIFPNLGNRYLWDDEAETALLAKNVLRFGVPVAFDGKDLISQECGVDYDSNYLWRQTPWLPIYLTAASFRLLGADTFAARLPFALVGALAVPSLYVLAWRLFGDRRVAWLSVGCLLLSVPFLLYVRQCRYYSLVILSAIWVLYFFASTLGEQRLSVVGLALSLTALFHSNYLIFLGTAAGLALAFFTVCFKRSVFVPLVGAGLLTALINTPWLVLFDLRDKSSIALGGLSPSTFARNLGDYLRQIELYAFPSVVLLGLLGMWLAFRRGATRLEAPRIRMAAALAVFALGHVLVLAAMPFTFFRYVVSLLPVFALLLAYAIRTLSSAVPALAAVVLALVLLVDRADLVQGVPGSTLVKYLGEITHDFDGPIAGIVRYLGGAGRAGERVFITYGDLPLRFYTEFHVHGGQGCQPLVGWPPPHWIVVRYFFRFVPLAPGARDDAVRMREYLKARIASGEYRRIDLPQVDTVWENIPEPSLHVYRTPREGPRVVVFERVPAPTGSAAEGRR